MQPREKILAAIVGGLLALSVAFWCVSWVSGKYASRRVEITQLNRGIADKASLIHRAGNAVDQMTEWEHRSLPSDVELARTLYQNWLVELADQAKLRDVSIDANRGGMHQKVYHKLPFTVRAKGTLEQATQFLHAFYSTNHLHLLRDISLNPIEKSRELDLHFTIEALVLPTADRRDALNAESGARLELNDLAAYRDVIVKRDFFAAYVPPPPPKTERPVAPPPPPPSFDPSKFATLTAVVQIDDTLQAWVRLQTTGETLKLQAGDSISVGPFQGTVVRVGVAELEIESQGKRRLLALGKTLAQAATIE